MSTSRSKIPLQVAEDRAKRICRLLTPFCERVDGKPRLRIVGSIRRQKREVKDIDLICILRPRGGVDLLEWLRDNRKAQYAPGTKISMPRKVSVGVAQMQMDFETTQVDLYFATLETWSAIGLIRTGPLEHNKKLCTEALKRGWKFHTGGARPGIYDQNGTKLAGDTEASFFEVLGMEYKSPQERG